MLKIMWILKLSAQYWKISIDVTLCAISVYALYIGLLYVMQFYSNIV